MMMTVVDFQIFCQGDNKLMGTLLNWKVYILSELCNCNLTPADFWYSVSKSSGHLPQETKEKRLLLGRS